MGCSVEILTEEASLVDIVQDLILSLHLLEGKGAGCGRSGPLGAEEGVLVECLEEEGQGSLGMGLQLAFLHRMEVAMFPVLEGVDMGPKAGEAIALLTAIRVEEVGPLDSLGETGSTSNMGRTLKTLLHLLIWRIPCLVRVW